MSKLAALFITLCVLCVPFATAHALILESETKLVPDDIGFFPRVGDSVDMDGATIIAGATNDTAAGERSAGAAHVFVLDDGEWIVEGKLIASDAEFADAFGLSVAVSGDIAVVGAPFDDDHGSFSGSAYVFVRNGGAWTQEAKLTASDATANDSFGRSVAISGETVLVGAPRRGRVLDGRLHEDAGAVYVFERDGGLWTEQVTLTDPTANAPGHRGTFGYKVAIDDDTMVVSALRSPFLGHAYVLIRTGTTWTVQAKLRATDANSFRGFGHPVSIDGDTIAVGESQSFDGGSVFMFVRDGNTWSEQGAVRGSDVGTHDDFGRSLDLRAGTLAVGTGRGESAYMFVYDGTAWSFELELTASDGVDDDSFGRSVAAHGETVAVGAPRHDGPARDSGAIYVFATKEEDTDGDGIPDDVDACPTSDLTATVIIDVCDSGVENILFEDGCTTSDEIAQLIENANNHGQFTSSVTHLSNELAQDGIIANQEKGAIQSCAAQANLP